MKQWEQVSGFLFLCGLRGRQVVFVQPLDNKTDHVISSDHGLCTIIVIVLFLTIYVYQSNMFHVTVSKEMMACKNKSLPLVRTWSSLFCR